MTTHKFIDNNAEKRFELHVDNSTAFAEYTITDSGAVSLYHTLVPEELGGRGIASEMIKKALENIQERNLKVIPICPFVKGYIERNPEWISLVEEQTTDSNI